ncbi:hypothetical protein C9994_06475 [Marivirga lumbricoides]|uniref:YcxB-like protein domain-containing protein n=1 Tax=Marivirga lumbricoides TaxID=1046115 RepID=A0A2T4DSA1_9BACT|nr:hypothetical protein C9994_06475 [Marivirga lumbricoides]
MKMHQYQLIHIPRGLYTLRLLLILVVALALPFLVLMIIEVHLNFVLIISICFLIAFLLFKLSARLVRNDLYAVINRDSLTIIETSSITKKNRKWEFNWTNLNSYVFETTQYYHILRLYIAEDKKITLTFDHNSQDFSRFEKDFHDKVSAINKNRDSVIYMRPSIYETKTGLILAALLVLLMIGWPIAAWWNSKDFQIGLALIFYSGAGFFIYMVYQYRRSKK